MVPGGMAGFSDGFSFLISIRITPASSFVKPFSWKRLFFTYVVPVVPLFTFVDGAVSCLRTYSPEELKKLVEEVQKEEQVDEYEWETGRERFLPFLRITYLIGYPMKSD